MLFRQEVLAAIAAGKVTCAFRRWTRPTVKAGGMLQTAAGVLHIDEISVVSAQAITARDARAAGHATREELFAALAQRTTGTIHRIRFRLAGPDPRLALRERTDITTTELAALRARLDRLDAFSPHGPWTRRVMRQMLGHPKTAAGILAADLSLPKDWLKVSIRKLRHLGLTISHEPGYEISPRGRVLLHRIDQA